MRVTHQPKLRHGGLLRSGSRPILFIATLVTVSVLGWVHRFQEADTQSLILSTMSSGDVISEATASASASASDEDQRHGDLFKPAAQRRSMSLRDEQKGRAATGETTTLRETARLEIATTNAMVEADQAQTDLESLQQEVDRATKALKEAQDKLARAQQQQEAADGTTTSATATKEQADEETEDTPPSDEETEDTPPSDEETEDTPSKEETEDTPSKEETEDTPSKEETEVDTPPSTQETTVETVEVSATSTTTTSSTMDRKVYFMPFGQVDEKDAFSASWLQTREDFMTMELHRIGICEDAAFRAFRGTRRQKLRMTLDWLDFSLEHLSKWWKMLQIFRQPEVYDTAMVRFDTYLGNAAKFELEPEQSFRETIAVIAYQPYRDEKVPQKAYNLTLKSLGATLESLRRAGFGRVVVVGGDREKDGQLTQDTFAHLAKQVDPTMDDNTIPSFVTKVGHMEVGYAEYNPVHAVTKNQKRNVPKATLEGLREAFELAQKRESRRTKLEERHIKVWLGNNKLDWKYVYLTEPDSILQFRPNTLKQLKEKVDEGMVLVPHRLQPIPHESDARGSAKDFLYLPEDEFPVIDLDSIGDNDSCCDAHQGPKHKPGKQIESCGNFWYMCDFTRRKPKAERTHKRIKQYSLIRLKQGTEIVSLAGLEHGRPCIPKKNDVCLPPPDVLDQQQQK